MSRVRSSAVGGLFYTDNRADLIQEIDSYITNAPSMNIKPEIIISPHAGIVYSGQTAGYAYKQLQGHGFCRVLLVGPSHYVGFEGFAFSDVDVWQNVIKDIPIDVNSINNFLQQNKNSLIFKHNTPHQKEHSLEVQLPFLIEAIGDFMLIPIVYGKADYNDLVDIFNYFKDDKTVIVISSDLSHFYNEQKANYLDSFCHKAIEKLEISYLDSCEACGKLGIKSGIVYAKANQLNSKMLHYSTSASTSNDYNRVVGYGSYMFWTKRKL